MDARATELATRIFGVDFYPRWRGIIIRGSAASRCHIFFVLVHALEAFKNELK